MKWALRKVNGAVIKICFVQLSVELLIVQFIALVAGLFFIEIYMSRFLEFTRIAPNSYYGEILVYLFIVIALSLLLAQIPLYHFRRRTLQDAVKWESFSKQTVCFRDVRVVNTIDSQSCFHILYSGYNETDLFPEAYRLRNGTS